MKVSEKLKPLSAKTDAIYFCSDQTLKYSIELGHYKTGEV